MANRLETFEISVVGANAGVGTLYSNGRQQCIIAIKVLKINDANVTQPLTASELDSVTVLPYSNALFPPMPTGWSCDKDKNGFDEGGPQGGRIADVQGHDVAADASVVDTGPGVKANDKPVIIYRYMRFASSQTTAISSIKFMACMTLDAGTSSTKKISTYFNDGSHQFDVFVTLQPRVPYRLRVSDLKENMDNAFREQHAKSKYVDVDIYYWSLPSGFRIVSEKFDNMGYYTTKLKYAYVRSDDKLFLGVAITIETTSLTLGDIGNLPHSDRLGPTSSIRLCNSNNTLMRAARYACDGITQGGPTYDKLLEWRIIDNFGCESRFILKCKHNDNGNELALQDG